MRNNVISVTLVLALILSLAALPHQGYVVTKAQARAWTIMVYVAADNNLEPFALKDVDEMEKAHPGNGVTVIALVDRTPADYEHDNIPPYVEEVADNTPQWTDAKIILVQPDDSPGIHSQFLTDLGEVDTGDPATLEGFIRYAITNYPADHYALIIWDHGGGPGGVAWDDTNGMDYLSLKEIKEAVERTGLHLDLIGFDACLMATIDAAYEFRNIADFMAASEETEPGDGWPYDEWLPKLIANPSMSGRDLGIAILESYMDFYRRHNIDGVTFSVADLRPLRTSGKIEAIKNFVSAAINSPEPLRQARLSVQTFGGGPDPVYGANQVDLVELLQAVRTAYGGVVDSFLSLLGEIIVANDHYGSQVSRANGLSAHYPLRYNRAEYVRDTSFSTDVNWAGLLDVAVNLKPQISEEPAQGMTGGEIRLYHDFDLATAEFGAAGPMDFDGDGAEEFVVFSTGLGNDNNYYVLLSISKYFSDSGLAEVYDTDVDYSYPVDDASPFIIGGVMGEDIDGDGAEEFIDAYTWMDISSENVYASIDKYEYAGDGTVNSEYVLIDNLVTYTADLGDFDGDGNYEIAVGGYYINFSTYEFEGRLYILSASDLSGIAHFAFDDPAGNFTDVAEIASGDVDGDGAHELVIGYNAGDLYPDGSYVVYSGHILVTYLSGTDLIILCEREHQGESIVSVTTGDIDSDGLDEIIYVTQGENGSLTLYVEKVDSNYNLVEMGEWRIDVQNALAYVQTFDLDGDGIIELLLTIAIFDEYGTIQQTIMDMYSYIPSQVDFDYEGSINMTGEYRVPIPTDLNGDGHMDVVFLIQRNDGVYLSIGQVENYVNPVGRVEGQVLDRNGHPVAGAYVEIMLPRATYYANTTTDDQGRFHFDNVPAGSYQVSAYWYIAGVTHLATDMVTVEEGQTTQVTLVETPQNETTTTTTTTTTTASPMPTTTTTATQPPTTTTTTTTTPTTTTIATPTPTTTTQPETTTTSTATTTTTTTTSAETTTEATTTTTYTASPSPPSGFDWGTFGIALAATAVIVVVGGVLAMRRRRAPPPMPPPPP